MNKLRWGVLGTSHFAKTKFLPAVRQCRHAEFTAGASRTLETARSLAAHLGIEKAYGSYDELLADPAIDVIYNPLPNHLHVPWSIKAIEAGKHVLCEKPIGLSASDAQLLLNTASSHPQLKIMEAFMYRFHPQWQYVEQAVNEASFGDLRSVHSVFSYFNVDRSNIRNQAAIGGGALMDIGCYSISLSRFLFNAEPQRVLAIVENDPEFQTDRLVSGILDFGGGTSQFTCSTQLSAHQRVIILGTTGRIEIEVPFNPAPEKRARLWHQRGGQTDEIEFPICNQYTIQTDQFSLAVLNNSPVPTPLSDAVANMKVIDALRASSTANAWMDVAK
jgi:predicted dehydrogenase